MQRLVFVQQIREMLPGTHELQFQGHNDEQRYAWIGSMLKRFDDMHLKHADHGVVLAYIRHLSGYSRTQVTQLVTCWQAGGGSSR